MRNRSIHVAICLLISASSPVMAEVSDKVMHPPQMWGSAITGVVVGLALGFLVSRWLGAAAMVAGLLLGPFVGIATVLDASVGPAILREAGGGYALHACASALFAVAGIPFAIWRGRRVTFRRSAG